MRLVDYCLVHSSSKSNRTSYRHCLGYFHSELVLYVIPKGSFIPLECFVEHTKVPELPIRCLVLDSLFPRESPSVNRDTFFQVPEIDFYLPFLIPPAWPSCDHISIYDYRVHSREKKYRERWEGAPSSIRDKRWILRLFFFFRGHAMEIRDGGRFSITLQREEKGDYFSPAP